MQLNIACFILKYMDVPVLLNLGTYWPDDFIPFYR